MVRQFKNFLFGKLSGSASQYYDGTGAFSTPVPVIRKQITITIQDSGGGVISTGIKQFYTMPVAGTWKKWRIGKQ